MRTHQRQYIKSQHLLWVAVILVSIAFGISSLFVKPVFAFAAIVAIVNLPLLFKYPFWGLLAYLIVFLYRPAEVYPALAAVRPELILGLLVVAAILLNEKLKTGKISLPTDALTMSLVAFLIVMAASGPTSYWRGETIDTCIAFTKTLVFYFMIISVINSRKRFLAFVGVYVVLIGKVAYDALSLYMAGNFIHTMGIDRLQGATSFGGDPNSLANTMAVSMPLVVAAAVYFRNWFVKLALFGLTFFTTYLIAITGSRGGLLSFFAVLLGGFIFVRQKVLIIFVALAIVIGGWQVLPEQYKERYMTLTEVEDVNEVSSGRWEIWKSGLRMIAARPILGVGAGAFAAALGSGDFGRPRWMRAHNLYIEVMASTGIIGFVVWFGFFARQLLKRLRELLKRASHSEDNYWMALFGRSFVVSLVSLAVSGLFGHNLYRFNWYMIAGLTVAMCAILNKNETKTAETETPVEGAVTEAQK